MDWLSIIGLLALGVILIGVEIVFIPGTTLIGVLGFAASSCGVYFAYAEKGSLAGHLSLVGSVAFAGLLLYIGYKTKLYKKMSLNDVIAGKSPNQISSSLQVGLIGKSVSNLRPSGQALFQEEEYEVHSSFGFIDNNTAIEIIDIKDNKIFVKTKS